MQDINLMLYKAAEKEWGTQRAMASHFDLSPTSLNRLFNGGRKLEICRFVNVCHALEILPQDLIKGSMEKTWQYETQPMTNQKVAQAITEIRHERMKEFTAEEQKALSRNNLEHKEMDAAIRR